MFASFRLVWLAIGMTCRQYRQYPNHRHATCLSHLCTDYLVCAYDCDCLVSLIFPLFIFENFAPKRAVQVVYITTNSLSDLMSADFSETNLLHDLVPSALRHRHHYLPLQAPASIRRALPRLVSVPVAEATEEAASPASYAARTRAQNALSA
jgi:hypothetical protein